MLGFPVTYAAVRRQGVGRELVWHYTTVEALVGIVQSRELWASSRAALNDPTENSWGRDALREVLSAFEDEGWPMADGVRPLAARESDFLERVIPKDYLAGEALATYVVAASAAGDKLSQWVHYAGAGGVAIGIAADQVLVHPETYEQLPTPGYPTAAWGWLKMFYERETQLNALREVLVDVAQGVNRDAVKASPSGESDAVEFFRFRLETVVMRLKHPAFSEEEEVRHFAPRVDVRPRFRARGSAVLAFVPLISQVSSDLDAPWRAQLPIREIRIGPAVSGAQRREIEALLAASGLPTVNVTASTIPYIPRAQ